MNLREMVHEGVERNILVYDMDATQGQMTPRLLQLMCEVAKANGLGRIRKWYIDHDGIYDLVRSIYHPNPFLYSHDVLRGIKYYGIPVQPMYMDPLVKVMEIVEGGSLQSHDTHLVVAECDHGPLLGSY